MVEPTTTRYTRLAILFVLVLPFLVGRDAVAQTPPGSACSEFGSPTISKSVVADLYVGRAATGTESEPIVALLNEYGQALQSGDTEAMSKVITAGFDENIGWSECADFLEVGDGGPVFSLSPLRVTTNGGGGWLAFIQRSYEDGSPEGYRDVFMVVAIEDDAGNLRIDFAHRDIRFDDGTTVDAEVIYLNGVGP